MGSGSAGGTLVSVYIVNRNYGRFLQQSIESALSQDYPHCEFFIIDDASDDDSERVLARFDGRRGLRVIRHSSRRGLTVCANTALRVSRGEFVMRLDADDYLATSAVRTMVEEITRDPAAVLVSPNFTEVDAQGKSVREVRRRRVSSREAVSDIPAHGACSLIRRTFLESIGGYDESVPRQDGLDLWLHLEPQHRVRSVAEPLFFYRRHGGNLTCDEAGLMLARADIFAKHVARRGLNRPRVLAVVTSSGQSAHPLRLLGDRPLIDWTIDDATFCEGIDNVLVSTGDRDVLDHVRQRYGPQVKVHFGREAPTGCEADEDEPYDAVMKLRIESPFRSAVCMQQAVHIMQLFDARCVLSVRPSDEVYYRHDGVGLQPLRSDARLRREQDDLFVECGGLRLERVATGSSPKRERPLVLDQRSAFTLRSELDWQTARYLAGTDEPELRGGGSHSS